MNPGEFSIKNNRVILVAMALAMIGGIIAYLNIGRLEDPEFTIKQALIITPYPGASASEVAQEVSNPIEIACQQLAQLGGRQQLVRQLHDLTVDLDQDRRVRRHVDVGCVLLRHQAEHSFHVPRHLASPLTRKVLRRAAAR